MRMAVLCQITSGNFFKVLVPKKQLINLLLYTSDGILYLVLKTYFPILQVLKVRHFGQLLFAHYIYIYTYTVYL